MVCRCSFPFLLAALEIEAGPFPITSTLPLSLFLYPRALYDNEWLMKPGATADRVFGSGAPFVTV